MKDDLFERLHNVDPATDGRILQEARALGDTPGRIAASEPTNVRRFPKTVRRRATLVAIAAVVVLAIALPLTMLRSLGESEDSPAGDGGNWVTVGSLADMRDQGVVYVPQLTAFVIVEGEIDPYALSAGTWNSEARDGLTATGSAVVVTGSRALYCEPSQRFVDPAGNVFDRQGTLLTGPGSAGLDRLPLRTVDGDVQIDAPRTGAAVWTLDVRLPAPEDLGCLTANGLPLEGRPGFAIPNGTELPPITVALPQTGAFVQSPITITGSANVFEATVSIRVLDAAGEVIAETFTTAACGTGCRGEFSAEVEVPIDVEQPGTIQVFETSAQDGSMINTVEIPVTLAPGLAPGVSNNVEGVWYGGDGAAAPNASAGTGAVAVAVFHGPSTTPSGSRRRS